MTPGRYAILGLVALATCVVVRGAGRGDRKVHAYYAAMRADLQTLARAESTYFATHGRFTRSLDSLGVQMSVGVIGQITRADSGTWEVRVTHVAIPTRCRYTDSATVDPVPSFSALKAYCENAP